MRLRRVIQPLSLVLSPRVSAIINSPPGPSIASANDAIPQSESRPALARPRFPVQSSTSTKFMQSLRRLVMDRQVAYASDIFHQVMKVRFQTRERSRIFAKATSLFLAHGHSSEAMQIYSYMTHEGFIPPTNLRATMYIIRRLASQPFPDVGVLLAATEELIKDRSFDEDCLRFLMEKLLQVYNVPASVVEQIVEMFVLAQPSGYTLSEKTEQFMAYVRDRLSPRITERTQEVSDLLEFLKSRPQDAEEIISLRRRISESPQPTLALLNSLVNFSIRHRRYGAAFNVYRIIKDHDPKGPTAQVYSLLFHTVGQLSKEKPYRTHQVKKPDNTPALRELFCDMLRYHLKRTGNQPGRRSSLINGSLLNQAIRYFVLCQDYAGAYVALSATRLCNIPVTLDTYKFALSPLVDRLGMDVPRISVTHNPEKWWAYRFLGFPDGSKLVVDVEMIKAIRYTGEDPEMSLKPLAWTKEERLAERDRLRSNVRHRYWMPSVSLLLGLAAGPGRKSYSQIPLYRILRRAILATPRQMFVRPANVVSKAVREAKLDMLPKTLRGEPPEDTHEVRFGSYGLH